jgi:AhpD family alkylhydroperoxidase
VSRSVTLRADVSSSWWTGESGFRIAPIPKEIEMEPRMNHPAMILPGAMQALQALHKAADSGGVPAKTIALVELRASQINGCSVCVEMHSSMMQKQGETTERLFSVAAWQDAPFFDDAERAALALTEAVTRLSDRSDPVPDAIWAEATRHYDEKALAALLLAISGINVWNRLNAATRQVAGAWRQSAEARQWVEGEAVAR